MTELFISGKKAVIKENVSFKLTKENVLFTKSSSYTYDIELPLNCPENIAIFSNINRKDVEIKTLSFDARLYSDNELLVAGTAIVTQATDESIKVQMLGGNSEMNFFQKGEKQYVDELDLSNWITLMFPSLMAGGSSYNLAYDLWAQYIMLGGAAAYEQWKKILWGLNSEFVAFPIFNETNSTQCNDYILRQKNGGKLQLEFRMSLEGSEDQANGNPQVNFAIQPYFYFMIERVIKALGYQISINEIRDNPFFKRIFIANANTRIELAKALPHWSVNDFITQVENFFGVIFKVDEKTKSVQILFRSNYIKQGINYINEIVDEHTVEIDKEADVDFGSANIAYSNIDDKMEKLSEEVLAAATTNTEYKTITKLKERVAAGLTAQDKKYIYECEGRQFIALSNPYGQLYLQEVNVFRNFIRDKERKDTDVELKIIPAKTVNTDICIVSTAPGKNGYLVDSIVKSSDENCLARPDRTDFCGEQTAEIKSEVDIQNMIEGENLKDDTQDIIYVAINDGKLKDVSYLSNGAEYPVAYTKDEIMINSFGATVATAADNLSLNSIPGTINIASEVLEKQIKIDKKVKYCFQFISDKIPDQSFLFIIQNKKYLCEKLEVKISTIGKEKIITGYFYKI